MSKDEASVKEWGAIRIDPEIYARLKQERDEKGISMIYHVRRALRQYFGMPDPKPATPGKSI